MYQLGDKGRLEVLQEKDNFTQVISSFCIDNLQKEDGGPVSEVIVTDPGDCLDVVSFSEDTEEEEDDLKFEKLILIIISPISLFCIAVTGLVYLGKTFLRSPEKQKEKDKIILWTLLHFLRALPTHKPFDFPRGLFKRCLQVFLPHTWPLLF